VTVDELLEQLNSAELRHLTERQNMRRAIVQLHDALQESMSTHGRPAWFDKQVEAALTAAAPFIDDTARQVRVGTLDNWNGNQLLIEVFADGQFHIAERENSWDTWNVGQWGWLS
jgi:hypothetical protein